MHLPTSLPMLRTIHPHRHFSTARHLRKAVSANHKLPQAPKSRTTGNLPLAPLVAIFALGSASFYYIVKSREGQGRPGGHKPIPDHVPASKQEWPRNTASDQTLSRR
ncbi:hypothetical protein B0A48_02570 [Cryoendolithus antarcticus]|uniref:Uncharacterized protein n=1 Tax=Cryoendolithus antarcticus TaxID=1507870 RepID=A0A1V8TP13_9PEZI|nr:hypothetical protein B0A48_02570 [Cryoendolithus antarcticus]